MDLSFWVGVFGVVIIAIAGIWAFSVYGKNNQTPPRSTQTPPPANDSAASRAYLRSYESPDNESFPKMLKKMAEVIQTYTSYIPSAKVEQIELNDHETVLKINDSLIVYFGICINNNKDFYKERERIESRRPLEIGESTACYFLKIEELTYNDVFKFDIQKLRTPFFKDEFFIGFRRFWGVDPLGALYSEAPIFERIANEYPELGLSEWFERWSGVRCHFIIFKIENQGVSAYCVKHTSAKDPKASARRFKKQIVEGTVANIFDANNFLKLRKDIAARSEAELNDAITFYLIEKMIKNSDDLEKLRGMLQQALNENESESTEEALKRCQSLLGSF